MEILTGDLWNELGNADLILVTTNSFVRKDGALVMGRGAAQQARDRFPGIDVKLGELIRSMGCAYPSREPYGCVFHRPPGQKTTLGLFQVKYHWQDDAEAALIVYSAAGLNSYLERVALAEGRIQTVAMNFPGIGNGRLKEEDVLPLLQGTLTYPVRVYKYA